MQRDRSMSRQLQTKPPVIARAAFLCRIGQPTPASAANASSASIATIKQINGR